MSDPSAAMATMVGEIVASIDPIAEATLGYRCRLEREGWSAEAAESFAGALHERLLDLAFGMYGQMMAALTRQELDAQHEGRR